MRTQERQLVAVRLAVVVLGAAFLAAFGEPIQGRFAIIALLGGVAAYSLLIPLLLRRLPTRPVAVLGVTLDVVAVSGVVFVATNVPDSYLFYGLVILGTAIRFGLVASLAASGVMSLIYAGIVMAGGMDADVRALLPVRVLYLVTFGVVAGLFSRIIVGRASENIRLQQRLEAERHERQRADELELLGGISRDFGASIEREATQRAIASGSAPLLGDATLLLTIDEAEGRLVPVAVDGPDPGIASQWRALADVRRPRLGEGVIGSAAATGTSRVSRRGQAESDPDGIDELGVGWMLAVPILSGGRVFGVLATVGAGDAAGDGLGRLAEALADRAGPPLQNAQVWSDLQERVVREQDARRSKDDFLSVVSHELRTPLTSIQGYSQLLEARLRGERGTSKEMAHVRVILSQVTRMRRLVDDLLDANRLDRSGGVRIETVDFDLSGLLRDAVRRIVHVEPQREITLSSPSTLPVHLDRERIDQVLSNLIENAVKYSPDGGPIRVAATKCSPEIEVTVTDTGMGVPPEQRDQIFERFFQVDDGPGGGRRFGGLGLGLAISRAIVKAHGGRIWCADNVEAGRGSVFGFRVPRIAMPTEPPNFDEGDGTPPFIRRPY